MKKENSLFLITAILTLFVAGFIKHDELYRVPIFVYVITAVAIIAGNIILKMKKYQREEVLLWNICSVGFFLTMAFIPFVHYIQLNYFGSDFVTGSISIVMAVVLGIFAVMILKMFKQEDNAVFLVLFWAFLLRVFFVVLSQGNYFQNDLGVLAKDDYGHLGYIYYLYENGRLPETFWNQYYHPPLHHIICALVMKVCAVFGMAVERMDEVLQCLSLFYTTATLGYINKIGKKFGLDEKGRIVAVLLAAFMPYNIMMSGALNNDSLVTLLSIMFVYYLVCWYQNPTMGSAVLMALCMGLGMMTKFSAVLIAPAAAVIMLEQVWEKRKKPWKCIGQLVVFGVIVFPLGLWHSLRNYYKFDLPLGFVPSVAQDAPQYIGMYDIKQRIFDFTGQFEPLCLIWSNAEENVSYNIPVSLVKYAAFGESGYYLNNSVVEMLGTFMFWTIALVFLLMPIGILIWLTKKDNQNVWKLFILLGAGAILYFYMIFCSKYPHICTMNVRYIMVALFMGCLAVGAGLVPEKTDGRMRRIKFVSATSIMIVAVVYAIGCSLLILNLGFWL